MTTLKNNDLIIEAFKSYYQLNDEQIEAISRQYSGLPFHTFQGWKELGYSIKKGSKGKIIYIWKYATKKQKQNEEIETDASGRFIKVKAYFFDISQVTKRNERKEEAPRFLPSLVYSDIKPVLLKQKEKEREKIYIKDNKLYIDKEKYHFTLNINNIIKLKQTDFKKILSEIKGNEPIINDLIKYYNSIDLINTNTTKELRNVYKNDYAKGRNIKAIRETISKNIKALKEIAQGKETKAKEQKPKNKSTINNLSQLKKHLQKGAQFKIVYHQYMRSNPGTIREITKAQTI